MCKNCAVTQATRFVSRLLHPQKAFDNEKNEGKNCRIRLPGHDEQAHAHCAEQKGEKMLVPNPELLAEILQRQGQNANHNGCQDKDQIGGSDVWLNAGQLQ